MYERYHVSTSRGGSFWITITDLVGGGDLALILGGIAVLLGVYFLFGTPVIIWPLIFKEFLEEFESTMPFWTLLGIQIVFSFLRVGALDGSEEPSFARELVLQGIVFLVAFELVQCVGYYQAIKAVDPALLREAGYDIADYSFWKLVWMHLTSTYDSIGMLIAQLYIGYTGAFIPAAATCLLTKLAKD